MRRYQSGILVVEFMVVFIIIPYLIHAAVK